MGTTQRICDVTKNDTFHSQNHPPIPKLWGGGRMEVGKKCFNGGGSKFFSRNGWVGKNGEGGGQVCVF